MCFLLYLVMFPYVVEFVQEVCVYVIQDVLISLEGHYFIFTLFSPEVMSALSYLISCTVSWIKKVASSS